MKRSIIPLAIPALLLLHTQTNAADPTWWSTRGVTNTSPASNLSPATIGQAKHMVAMALAELQTRLTPADFQALQTDVAAIVSLALPQTPADFDNQKQVLLSGQLKAMAKPFYDRLRLLDAAWIENQMNLAGIRLVEPSGNPMIYSQYPWSVAQSDDSNYSPASLGQLKAVFSLHFENWGVSVPDSDGDGTADISEGMNGTSPDLYDSDGDGHKDSIDAFPLDPSQHSAPTPVPGDTIAPVVSIDSPANAVKLAGP